MNIDTARFEQAMEHAGEAAKHIGKFLVHFVAGAAPIAAAVGTAIGNPAVIAGAKAAGTVAQGIEAVEAEQEKTQ
jgi:hypothetical protein